MSITFRSSNVRKPQQHVCTERPSHDLVKKATYFPFGIWFADANTLYVGDEGNGDNTYSNGLYTVAASQTTAGLQKWIFDSTSGQWNLAYVIQAGLQLGVPYTITNYPTGNNSATGLPWSPGTDGLRNITGVNNGDGTVTIYAITSTVSGSDDRGADPNKLAVITDELTATSLPSNESFNTFTSANFAEVLRGVSLTPQYKRLKGLAGPSPFLGKPAALDHGALPLRGPVTARTLFPYVRSTIKRTLLARSRCQQHQP